MRISRGMAKFMIKIYTSSEHCLASSLLSQWHALLAIPAGNTGRLVKQCRVGAAQEHVG